MIFIDENSHESMFPIQRGLPSPPPSPKNAILSFAKYFGLFLPGVILPSSFPHQK